MQSPVLALVELSICPQDMGWGGGEIFTHNGDILCHLMSHVAYDSSRYTISERICTSIPSTNEQNSRKIQFTTKQIHIFACY